MGMNNGCPNCDKPTLRLVEHWSLGASLDYWRCEACGHVAPVTKNEADVGSRALEQKPLPAPPVLRAKPDRRRAS